MKQLVYTIALMLVLVGTAAAQRNTNDAGLWDGSTTTFTNLGGVEASAGFVDQEDNTLWAHTFVMRNGDTDMTVSFNYTSFTPNPDAPNTIVGGTWTMNIYSGGEHKGMVFGEFTGGTIEWKMDRTGVVSNGVINAQMKINGGTESFADITATSVTIGNFYGEVSYNRGGHPIISGYSDLRF